MSTLEWILDIFAECGDNKLFESQNAQGDEKKDGKFYIRIRVLAQKTNADLDPAPRKNWIRN